MNGPMIDPKVRRHLRQYLFQVAVATAALLVTLWAETILSGGEAARAIVVAAIASTAFILFISPGSPSANPRHAIGGHVLALVIATPLALLADPDVVGTWVETIPLLFAAYAAVSVGASMFAMAATNTEHPPAAGTALALVAHGFSWDLVAFVVSAVLILVGIHYALRGRLADLY